METPQRRGGTGVADGFEGGTLGYASCMAKQQSVWRWWIIEHGGAPRWLLLFAGVFLVGCVLAVAMYRPAAVSADTSYTPAVIQEDPEAVVVYIGDSYTGGSAMNGGPETLWTAQIEGEIVPFSLAAGGSGYVAGNTNGGADTFVARAALVPEDSNVVIFLGSRNDMRDDYATVNAAASAAFTAAALRAPGAKIVVVGPMWVNATPPPALLETARAVGDAARAAGLTFVDPLTDRWFADEPGLIGSDGVHPTDAGHMYLAEKMQPIVSDAITAQRSQQ